MALPVPPGEKLSSGGSTRRRIPQPGVMVNESEWADNTYAEVNPSRMAYLVSSATLLIFNLTMTCWRWVSTVLVLNAGSRDFGGGLAFGDELQHFALSG